MLSISHISAQPKIIDMDDTLRKDPGEQVNITCRATGNPAPAVKWVVKTGEGRHAPITQWSHENHTLRIDSVQEHHYGEYVCFAENKFGNDTVVLALGKSNVPVGYKPNIPIGKSNIPSGTSNVPVGKSNIPMGKSNIPVGTSNIPAGKSNVPVGKSNIPMGTSYVPVGKSNIPMSTSNIPVGTSNISAGTSNVPVGKSNHPLQF